MKKIERYLVSLPQTPPNLQIKAVVLLALRGNMRCREINAMNRDHISINPNESKLSINCGRGKSLLMTDRETVHALNQYRHAIVNSDQEAVGHLWRSFDHRRNKFSSARRGFRWFQNIEKEIYRVVGGKQVKPSFHMYASDPFIEWLMSAGQWRSEKPNLD